jgi:hypothetical protein
MSNNDKIYKNLITILKLFQNRPYHLAKYLIENESLSQEFMEKVKNSEKLNKINEGETDSFIKAIHFIDISHMKDFFDSLTDDGNSIDDQRDIVSNLNKKLDRFIKEEKYEDAIRIRDYMIKNNIDRKGDNF